MRTSILVIPLVFALLTGCASTETVREAQGQGVSRTYQATSEAVYNATLEAAKLKKLEVVESDKTAGRLILSNGISLWSWGERIAVFIKSRGNTETEVEIVSKPVLSPLNFPPDWQKILLDQVATELKSKN